MTPGALWRVHRLSPSWLHKCKSPCVDQKIGTKSCRFPVVVCPLKAGKMCYSFQICLQPFTRARIQQQKHTSSFFKRQRVLGFIPLENLDQETKSVKRKTNIKQHCITVHLSARHAIVFEWLHWRMLTYLVPSFVGFLHQHPPLVIQLHGHAAAAVGMFAHPAKKLL